MNIVHAFILGAVEGLTEFLPISSTAHLIITSKFLGLYQTEFQKFFEIFIQSGAILAVFLVYGKYVLKHKLVIRKILFSIIPTAIIGVVFYKVIKNFFFETDLLIICSLFLVGTIFLFVEYAISKGRLKLTRTIKQMQYKDALLIGLIQGLAVVPGVSRAGIVIVGMMLLRYRRDQAALYSFLLAVPTILAATGYDFYKSSTILYKVPENIVPLTIGFATSFVFAYFSIRWLIKYLQHNSLSVFGYYRIALAIILVVV